MKIQLELDSNKVIKGYIYSFDGKYENVENVYDCNFSYNDIKKYQSILIDNGDGTFNIDNSKEMTSEGKAYFKKLNEDKQKYDEKQELKKYLNDTDYVVSKLQESKLVDSDDDYKAMYDKYKNILEKRKEARAKINELEK